MNKPPQGRRWLLAATTIIPLIAVACLLHFARPAKNLPFSNDPRFVATTLSTVSLPSNASFGQRMFFAWYNFNQKFRKPNPAAYSFSPSGPTICSIHGLLNQCMEVTGVRYVIAKEVASGSLQFGHTNTLNGTQWVLAFTDALQNGKPQWWDSKTKSFRTENLVLLTNDANTVLVLPQTMAQEFQKK